MNVLLLVDLEGVAGVDGLADLLEGSPGFGRARSLLTEEVTAACRGFREGDLRAEGVLIEDSHRGGPSPTLDVERLPPGTTVHRGKDAYDFSLLDHVQAVACLGMHPGESGFVPHTVDLAGVWEIDGRAVSETDLFLGVAAERGLPTVFVAGDEALDARGLPFVATKCALSPTRSLSRDPLEVRAEIRRAARGRVVPSPTLVGDLAVRFRSRWMAEVAEGDGWSRLDETAVRVTGPSLAARISKGARLLRMINRRVGGALRPWAIAEDASAMASRSFRRARPPSRLAEARLALKAFLHRTEASDDWSRANRALALHMLEAHAPSFFASEQLVSVLAEAVTGLANVPRSFPAGLDAQLGMARLDAIYVLRERGQVAETASSALADYVRDVESQSELFAWLMGELAFQIGMPEPRRDSPPRPFRSVHRVADLLWLTHLYLLETRYLRRSLPRSGWESTTEELLLAVPFALKAGELDLAAELAFCLVAAGEDRAPERAQILAALAAHQQTDGTVIEPGAPSADPEQRARSITHATAAALLAFATAT